MFEARRWRQNIYREGSTLNFCQIDKPYNSQNFAFSYPHLSVGFGVRSAAAHSSQGQCHSVPGEKIPGAGVIQTLSYNKLELQYCKLELQYCTPQVQTRCAGWVDKKYLSDIFGSCQSLDIKMTCTSSFTLAFLDLPQTIHHCGFIF